MDYCNTAALTLLDLLSPECEYKNRDAVVRVPEIFELSYWPNVLKNELTY
jgi:hypothetical protein